MNPGSLSTTSGSAASETTARQVAAILGRLCRGIDRAALRITALGNGGQASVFLARRQDGRPLWQGEGQLAVKFYRSGTHEAARVIHGEFESLQRLYDRLDGTTLHGWKIRAPRPVLAITDEPFALVMTVVPGHSLALQLPSLPAAEDHPEFDSIAEAVVAALDLYWAGTPQLYGDLSVSNVLLERGSKTLSFIDANVPRAYYACEGVSREWYPASRDMANLLYVAAAAIRTTLHSPGLRLRRLQMSERILLAFLKRAESEPERLRLLREMEECMEVHLRRIAVSCTLGGSWRRFVQWTARRSVERIMRSLRASAPQRVRERVLATVQVTVAATAAPVAVLAEAIAPFA